MGTELLVIFVPVPFLFWAWDLRGITKSTHRRKSAALLVLGAAYMACFLLPLTTKQHFMQGWFLAGFFYAPFYLLASLVFTPLLRLAPNDQTKSD